MSARDDILRDVRRALGGGVRPHASVSRSYRDVAGQGDHVALFVERVEDYRATVIRCTAADLEATLAAEVGGGSFAVPNGFDPHVPGSVPDDDLSHAALDALDGVVTSAALAIATTGTIVLDHGPGQGRRALTLVPDVHVCVVRISQVVLGVADAVAALDPVRPQTWISGPSATSDIELSRVEGVHGPRTLHVILVDDA